jgi:hypothetical protein
MYNLLLLRTFPKASSLLQDRNVVELYTVSTGRATVAINFSKQVKFLDLDFLIRGYPRETDAHTQR